MRLAGEVTFLMTSSSFSIIWRASPIISSWAAISDRVKGNSSLTIPIVRGNRSENDIERFEQTQLGRTLGIIRALEFVGGFVVHQEVLLQIIGHAGAAANGGWGSLWGWPIADCRRPVL